MSSALPRLLRFGMLVISGLAVPSSFMRRRRRQLFGSPSSCSRQRKVKVRATHQLGMHPYSASVQVKDALDDGQAKS